MSKRNHTREPPQNVPGFVYFSRLTAGFSELLERQAAETEVVWHALSQGEDLPKALAISWARSVRNYYDLLLDAAKGPWHVPQPSWIYFSFTLVAPSEVATAPRLQSSAAIDVAQPPGTVLETTDFVSKDGRRLPGTWRAGPKSLYEHLSLSDDGRSVSLRLNVEEVNKQDEGLYHGLIAAKHHGGQPPLAVVVLHIEPREDLESPEAKPPRRRARRRQI